MASRTEFVAHTDVPPAVQFRSFSCGCRRVSGPGAEFHVEWCPHHEANHGELAESSLYQVEEAVGVGWLDEALRDR
jgi:hypothetical protein